MKWAIVVFIIILSFISSYIALYGWVGIDLNAAIEKSRATPTKEPVIYKGINYESEDVVKIIMRYEIAEYIFPFIYKIPNPICLFFAAIAFGYLGGLIKVLYDIIRINKGISCKTLCSLAMSSLSGLLILGISYVIPSALTASDITLRPLTLLFLCLFSGLFSEQTVSWLQKLYESKIIK